MEQHPDLTHLGGRRDAPAHQACAQLYQAENRLLLTADTRLQEEVFGPVAIVTTMDDDDAQLLQALYDDITALCR